ncbi:MAG TPA: threonine synthase [Terriglobales bacterium]|nr:threonine synthase [Terriglobales bacterium]
MVFCSTRDTAKRVTGSAAIVGGIAPDGGLYVPMEMPTFSKTGLEELSKLSYQELAATILVKFLPELGYEPLLAAAKAAYSAEKFGGETPVKVTNLLGRQSVLELWHGPTYAFKDMALQLLPHLLKMSLAAVGEKKEALILVATSGDTGKAALEGYSNVPGTKVAVFYPAGGVSEVQRLQMATHAASNAAVFAIEGNFDDTQSGVKRIFTNPEMQRHADGRGYFLSSANSINLGRLLPQVVYYFYAYFQMLKDKALTPGEKFDVAVPTGNFGDILAGWYACRMGLPIADFICASNSNNVLTDFFNTGVYDRNRPFKKTISPSMDILISSNLERLVFEMVDRNAETCASLMAALSGKGEYKIPASCGGAIFSRFAARWVDDGQTVGTIGELWDKYAYAVDTHTAVAFRALMDERKAKPQKAARQALVVSTASPFKFATAVLQGVGGTPGEDEFKNLEMLSKIIEMPLPAGLAELRDMPVRFGKSYPRSDMQNLVAALM